MDSLWHAVSSENIDEVTRLLQEELPDDPSSKKALLDQIDPHGSTVMHWAAHNGLDTIVQLLLTSGAQHDVPDHEGTTAFMRAALNDHLSIMHLLLEYGVDLNHAAKMKRTVLMRAVEFSRPPVVQLLLRYGADPNQQDYEGMTALSEVIVEDKMETIWLLLAAGADPDITDHKGISARYRGERHGYGHIRQIIVDWPPLPTGFNALLDPSLVTFAAPQAHEFLPQHRQNPYIQEWIRSCTD